MVFGQFFYSLLQVAAMGVCNAKGQTKRSPSITQASRQLFNCPYDNELANICISKNCMSGALSCDQENCAACSKLHVGCDQIKVSVFSSLIEKRKLQHQQFLEKIEKLQKQMFYALRERIKQYMESEIFDVSDKKYFQFVDAVYYKKKFVAIKGNEASDFHFNLTNTDRRLEQARQNLLFNFEKELQILTTSLKNIQKKTIKEYVRSRRSYLEQSMAKSQLTVSSTRETRIVELQSTIVTREKVNQLRFIQQSLQYPRKIQLIFRASEHGFRASRFHLDCDVPNTLTIIKTQFGRTIAGYTPLAWNSGKSFTRDQSGKSFLLLLESNQRLNLVDKQKAIQCIPNYGPVFGGGSDLAITDECHIGSKCVTHFPYSYNYQGQYSYNQDAWTAICGVPHGKYFNVKQYQVFRVVW